MIGDSIREASDVVPWMLVVGGPKGGPNRSWSWLLSGDGSPGGLGDIRPVEMCNSRCTGACSSLRVKELGSIDGSG